MSAFPIYRNIPSVGVEIKTAHKLLEGYLEATKSSPYLLPYARLEADGPTTGPSNSLARIYYLKRLEAGLRGEWLDPSLDANEGEPNATAKSSTGANGATEGWQDLDEYQREQEVVEGEIAPLDTEVELEAKPTVIDKEARKKEKKLRMKEEKRRKAKGKESKA